MIWSRVVGSKVLKMAIQFEYFFWLNGKMANVMLEILDCFPFGMRLPAFKAFVFTSDF